MTLALGEQGVAPFHPGQVYGASYGIAASEESAAFGERRVGPRANATLRTLHGNSWLNLRACLRATND